MQIQASFDPVEQLRVWRHQMLMGIMRSIVIVASIAVILPLQESFVNREYWRIPILLGTYGIFILTTFWGRVTYTIRAATLLAIIYLLGIYNLVLDAQTGTAYLFLLTIPITTTLLFGQRWGRGALLITILILAAFGWGYVSGRLTPAHEETALKAGEMASWAIRTIVFFMLNLLLVLPQDFLFGKLTAALAQSHDLTRELGQRQAELEEQTSDLLREIAERRRAQAALLESEARYRQIVDYAPAGIFEIDINATRLISANDIMCDYTGYTRDEILALNPFDLLAEDSRQIYLERQAKILAGEPVPLTAEFKIIAKDKHEFWVLLNSRISTEGDNTTATVVVQDITERKQAEVELERLMEQVQEGAQRIQQIVDTVPEGVLLLDAQAAIVLVNPLGAEYLSLLSDLQPGDPLTHLAGRPLEELLASPPSGEGHELLTGGLSFEVIARPIETGPTPGGWVLVIRDVTQQRLNEQHVQQQERLAAVGQLAAGIAHDFNNIMAVISLYADISLQNPDLPHRVRERLETINQQAHQASDLTQQILDFSRRAVIERGPLDLLAFIKEQVKLLQRTLPENIRIGLSHGEASYIVYADPARIQQAIMNLATNARDAMPQGGHLRFDLQCTHVHGAEDAPLPDMEPGEWTCITVSDTGVGIPPEVLAYIFDPFITTKAPGEGTGLGLAQAYGIIHQHGGQIDVRTRLGEGTIFNIYLPALDASQPEPTRPTVGDLIRGKGQTILVVEDDQDTRLALVSSLELLGYRTLEASDGQAALELFKDQGERISLVLSDMVMPRMGGSNLFQALRDLDPDVKVVVTSGHPLENEEVESMRALGLRGWLPKPPTLEQLSLAVAQALRGDYPKTG